MKQEPMRWIADGQVLILDGLAWGITQKLKTIPLCTEQQVVDFFDKDVLPLDIRPLQTITLREIKEYLEVEGGATPTNMVRASNDGLTGGNKKATALHSKQKGTTYRKSNKKH